MTTNAQHDDQLARYLGEEMTADERAAFEARLRDDPPLSEEAASLKHALESMCRISGAEVLAAPTPRTVGQHKSSLLRYAAAIALAFFIGYGTRSLMHVPAAPEEAPSNVVSAGADDLVRDRFLQTYSRHTSRRGMARSLIALAHATNPGDQSEHTP